MKYFFILLLSITFSSTVLSQSLIDLGNKNPNIKDVARIRTAIMDGEKLYLGGNLNFVNNTITPPIIRLNADGSLDNTFIYNGNYSINFEDNLTGPSTVLNGSLYVTGEDGIIKINNDGSIDESFKITGVNFVNSMITYRDSLLVIGEGALMQLYSEDGNYRTIQTELSNDYYLLEIIKLSSDKILIRIQDKASGIFSYTLFENELVKDDAFIPFIVNQPGNIKNIQSLPTGEIFVAGGDIMVNETAGNGIFTINDLGALSANSIHGSDLSFIDVYGNGIESAIPIDGKIIIIGHTDNSNYSKLSVARLLGNGLRDDTFIIKDFEVSDVNEKPKMLIDSNNDIILINSQTSYNGQVSNGINKININGDNIPAYSVNLYSKGRVTQFDNYENDNYLISGSFIESALSKTAHISGFSLNANQSFPWINSVDLVASDLMGSAKVLSNGDIFIGAYDRSQSGIFKVYSSDGSAIDLGVNQAYAVEVTYPVSNIHESNDFIYATGVFSYLSKFNVIKLNKDYSIVSSYAPSVTQFGDNIPFSYLSNDDKLIVQITNSTDQTNNIIRLLPNGDKDNSFNDLTIGNMDFGGSLTFVVKDSLLVSQPIDFNNSQTLKSYNLDGTLLDDNFASINANAIISDIIAISDTTAIISGSFTVINGIAKDGIALMHFNGVIYDDLDLDITGSIDKIELKNDTLFILGPGAIQNKNNGGFYAINLKPNALNLNATSTSETGNIMLSWQSDQTIRYIDIYRSSPGNSTSLLTTLEKGIDSYTDENIEPNIPYTYNLVSRNIFGENSTEITFEVIKPNAPSNLSVQYNNGSIDLTWNDESDNEIGFSLFRKIDNGDFESIQLTDANVTNSTDISVDLDRTYTYFINAKSDNYFSESTDSVEIKIYLPSAPSNLSYNYNNSLATISLAWDYSDENAENIIIYESLDNQSFNALDTISSSELSFDKNNTIENGVYYYHIVAKNNIGLSNASETIEVNTSILGLDISVNQHHIFPNPSTGNLRIELNSNGIDEIIITDISGKIIQKIPTKGHSSISVSGLTSGIYLVGFATKNQLTEVEKIIVK